MKYALVTGGTRGIGLAIVKKLFESGYCVTALYSSDEESATRARDLLPHVAFMRADVSDEESVKKAFASLPALDVLVNNAGIALYRQVQDTSLSEWERVMAVNAGGVFLCCKHAVKKLIARGGGAIVNIASIWGETGGSCESAYSASKGAVIALSKALAKELAPSHITVNTISPGVIETEMNAHLQPEEREALRCEIPLQRMGRGEEVARLVLSVIEQPYLTGQDIALNGGLYI